MTTPEESSDVCAWVTRVIQDLCHGSENDLRGDASELAWGEPLVGFCRGDDPLFERFKEAVGSFHWTPLEIFQRAFPDVPVQAEELAVISWVLPQTTITKADNRRQNTWPAERWARSRIYGEEFNNYLREQVAAVLTQRGYRALAPAMSPGWQTKESERYVWASTWSERHIAHAAGLGTFGLCDGLITPVGKAMRVGSVVAHMEVPPVTRPYEDHHAYCLFYAQGTCGECIKRCPADAITEAGHNKVRCREHLNRTREYVESHYGFKGYGCGLCQTGVPCESGIPEG